MLLKKIEIGVLMYVVIESSVCRDYTMLPVVFNGQDFKISEYCLLFDNLTGDLPSFLPCLSHSF